MAQTALPPADLLPVRREATFAYRLVRLVGVPLLRLAFRFDPIEPRIHFLANPTILVTRKFQWFIVRKTGGFVPVVQGRHGDPALFHHVDRALAVGGAVAIFPEGSYGPAEGELLPFKKGFAHFAIKAGVPVVPVALSGTKDLWFRKRIKVVIGQPIPAAGQTPESLTDAGYQRIKELMPALHEEPGRRLLRKFLTNLF